MTAVTLQFEDRLFSKLKRKANHAGCSFDNYIIYMLNSLTNSDTISDDAEDIDGYLSSMQFSGINLPASETGKGVLAETKYM